MVKVTTLANAVAAVTGVTFVLCRLLAFIAPNLLFNIAQSWFHTFGLPTDGGSDLSFGAFILGLISSVVLSWVFTYAAAALYARWAK